MEADGALLTGDEYRAYKAAQARIAELVRERDEARDELAVSRKLSWKALNAKSKAEGQRDALLAALRRVSEWTPDSELPCFCYDREYPRDANQHSPQCQQARAAIALCEPEGGEQANDT